MIKKLSNEAWIVLADGERAALFLQDGEGQVQLRHKQTIEPQALEDDGPSGVRPPESSAKDTDEATFAKQLAIFINEEAKSGSFEQLILVADPSTLGQMRPILHSEVQKRLLFDVPKTLTSAPVDEIEKQIASEISRADSFHSGCGRNSGTVGQRSRFSAPTL